MKMLKKWKDDNESIVFTNGCFDLLHPGHIAYLRDASKLGDRLIVGLNSDLSVKRLKGEKRPINNEFFRKTMLESIIYVDLVIVFNEDTPLDLLKKVKPNILCKGGDYQIENIVGYNYMTKIKGQTLSLPFFGGFSTSKIISQIRSL